jgi:hypothetical protein
MAEHEYIHDSRCILTSIKWRFIDIAFSGQHSEFSKIF